MRVFSSVQPPGGTLATTTIAPAVSLHTLLNLPTACAAFEPADHAASTSETIGAYEMKPILRYAGFAQAIASARRNGPMKFSIELVQIHRGG